MTPRDDERLSALYRAGTQEEPPAHVDQQIRNAARRHAPRRHRGWMPALATAAVLVLAVAVMIRVPDERTDESGRGAPKPTEEVVPAPPTLGSSARKRLSEDVADQERPGKMERLAEPEFEYDEAIPSTNQAEAPEVESDIPVREQSFAPAAAEGVDEARESADSPDHEGVRARRLKPEADRCQPPDAMRTEDRETLLKRIEELERQGRHDEAECLRHWFENPPPR